jgi:SAM-dependent methyltransferase
MPAQKQKEDQRLPQRDKMSQIELKNQDEMKNWIDSQQWYQTIQLSNGLITPGKFDSRKRLKFLSDEEFSNKSVLDIGCNSGFYCLWAKKKGASRVVGIDIDKNRLQQARILTDIEQLDVEYYEKPIHDIANWKRFDIVFCFAVLTEIKDILGTLEILKNIIGQKAYVELALAKPLLYLSLSRHWLKELIKKRHVNDVCEIRHTKTGPVISPSLRMLKNIFAGEFSVVYHGKGLRYDVVTIERL